MSGELPEDRDEKYKVMRIYTVTFKDKTTRTIIANRFVANVKTNQITFWGAPDSAHNAVAYFSNVESVILAVNGVHPVQGVEYYTLEDLRCALRDLNYVSTDSIVDKVSQRVSVRDDGRYSIDELKHAATQTSPSYMGSYYTEMFDLAALQARKNRVFEAHSGS